MRPSLPPVQLAANRPASPSSALSGLAAATAASATVALVLLLLPDLRPDSITQAGVGAIVIAIFGAGLSDLGYSFLLGASRFASITLFTVGAWLYVAALGL